MGVLLFVLPFQPGPYVHQDDPHEDGAGGEKENEKDLQESGRRAGDP